MTTSNRHLQSWISDEAQAVWYFFEQISAIPRPSKKEDLIKRYITNLGQEYGFACEEDQAGNLWLNKAPTPGCESLAPIMLQAHLDMVCQKTESSTHNFDCDPIKLIKKAGYLYADNTTLGADNGLGVAAILALFCSDNIDHAQLEALLTVDEEAGMGGALGLQARKINSQVLLNLDSEQDGEITLGCAGGVDFDVSATWQDLFTPSMPSDATLRFCVQGARGGHSGVDIHKQRANAIRLGLGLLASLAQHEAFELVSVDGGNARNAIARHCQFEIRCPLERMQAVKAHLAAQAKVDFAPFQQRVGKPETELGLVIDSSSTYASQATQAALALPTALTQALIGCLLDLPDGVESWSQAYPEVVETSSNFSIMRLSASGFSAQFLLRSLFDHKRDALLSRFVSLINQAEPRLALRHHSFDQYPAWQPQYGTVLEKRLLENYQSIFKQEARVTLMHAGLECGLIGAVFPDLKMVSFGPTIESPHSPSERVEIQSVSHFWQLLQSLVKTSLI